VTPEKVKSSQHAEKYANFRICYLLCVSQMESASQGELAEAIVED